MRLTQHNARAGKNGNFLARHNDRDFNLTTSDHIDPERSRNNVYGHIYATERPEMTFKEVEMQFYTDTFSAALESQNERYRRDGHPERCRTIEDVYKSPRTCPEESIFQIGNRDSTISPEKLLQIYQEYAKQRREDFPGVMVLDYALHTDEEGAPHIHERVVWVGHNRDGQATPSQSKALTEMGVCKPHPDRPNSRYNNAKQTYTQFCRHIALSICHSRGLQIETDPQEPSRTGLTLLEYKTRQEQERAKTARQERLQEQYAKQEISLQSQITQHEVEEAAEQLQELQLDIAEQSMYLQKKVQQVKDVSGALDALRASEKTLRSIMSINDIKRTQIARNREQDALMRFNKIMRDEEER